MRTDVQHKVYFMQIDQIDQVRMQSRVIAALDHFISEQSRNFPMQFHAYFCPLFLKNMDDGQMLNTRRSLPLEGKERTRRTYRIF